MVQHTTQQWPAFDYNTILLPQPKLVELKMTLNIYTTISTY